MKHKHEWKNVMESFSTVPDRYMQILICEDCQAVKIKYEGEKRAHTVKKSKKIN